MEGYVVTDTGDKILPGSRRPDGTIRKERRVRAGYVPQDEQPVYQSNGVMSRRNIPKCPGLDPEQESSGSAAAKSKSAKKNEKRKAKKADEKPAGSSQQQQQQPASSQPPPPAAAAPQQQPPAAAAAVSDDPGAAALDKQIKALSKKVRQCQSLLQRQKDGDALSAQEQEKLAKMPGWQEEIKDLEHQMAKLTT